MAADQQIGLLTECQQARRDCVAASEADREQSIQRWADAVNGSNGLCTNDLHDALVMKDEKNHLLALEVIKRTDWKPSSFVSDLGSERLSPEQRARAHATLKALTGKDFGEDRAAWEAWFGNGH